MYLNLSIFNKFSIFGTFFVPTAHKNKILFTLKKFIKIIIFHTNYEKKKYQFCPFFIKILFFLSKKNIFKIFCRWHVQISFLFFRSYYLVVKKICNSKGILKFIKNKNLNFIKKKKKLFFFNSKKIQILKIGTKLVFLNIKNGDYTFKINIIDPFSINFVLNFNQNFGNIFWFLIFYFFPIYE